MSQREAYLIGCDWIVSILSCWGEWYEDIAKPAAGTERPGAANPRPGQYAAQIAGSGHDGEYGGHMSGQKSGRGPLCIFDSRGSDRHPRP